MPKLTDLWPQDSFLDISDPKLLEAEVHRIRNVQDATRHMQATLQHIADLDPEEASVGTAIALARSALLRIAMPE